MGFLQQFLEVFDELKGSDFYVTGESVSGLCWFAVLFVRVLTVYGHGVQYAGFCKQADDFLTGTEVD